MNTPYLEQNPIERAAEAQQAAREAVAEYRAKELSRAVPTVLRDHEAREES